MSTNELNWFWAEQLGWRIRPLTALEIEHLKAENGAAGLGYSHLLAAPSGEACFIGYFADELKNNVPDYTATLDTAKLVVDEMRRLGFWLKLTSPFSPDDPPKRGEEKKDHWWASFDYHGAADTHPLWQASSLNPAEAICLAAKRVMDEAVQLFGNGNDYVVAVSQADAADQWGRYVGDNWVEDGYGGLDEWIPIDFDQMFAIWQEDEPVSADKPEVATVERENGRWKMSATAENWATHNGRGWLCSLDW